MAEKDDGGINGGPYRLVELVSTAERDFLVKRNGDQVKVNHLEGKVVGLYFSASWCGPCQRFTPKLVNAYEELSQRGDFEVVFVSADEDQEEFDKYFSKMPWLAIPFSDSDIRSSLDQIFEVSGIPHLVILDGNGQLLTDDAAMMIRDYGAEAYPFSAERLQELKVEEETARNNQSLKSILVHSTRDFLVCNDGRKVPVTQLEGKTVGLLFSADSFYSCKELIPQLVEVYNKLKEKNFEIVLVSLDTDAESFDEGFEAMPWLALPFSDKTCMKLPHYFEIRGIPTLVIIGPDGKTLQSDVVEAIEDHGAEAYPFTSERMAALLEIEKAKLASQTIASLLVSDERNFVIGNGGLKVPVSDLVGKTVLLYFSAHWCPPCRAFSPKLIETYHEIKAKDSAFEIIFVSSDHDQAAFEEYFATMPFLALPYGDTRKKSLSKTFKVTGIPTLVAIGPSGRTLTKDARNLVINYGAAAYPFTEVRLKEVEQEMEEMAKQWPKEVQQHPLHEEHSLELSRRPNYICDACDSEGHGWSYLCADCDFDLHPMCALKAGADVGAQDDENTVGYREQDEPSNETWVCDGETCRKA
ncbi:probable nucleoredoxin 1 [Nymphaea colorata]|nr:probable nucleoredoxin 1 [Nymphaea colorata]